MANNRLILQYISTKLASLCKFYVHLHILGKKTWSHYRMRSHWLENLLEISVVVVFFFFFFFLLFIIFNRFSNHYVRSGRDAFTSFISAKKTIY